MINSKKIRQLLEFCNSIIFVKKTLHTRITQIVYLIDMLNYIKEGWSLASV